MMRARTIHTALGLLICSIGHAQHPVVETILAEMSIDSMMRYTMQLSGELPVDVGNGPQLIASRHKNHPGNAMAQAFIEQKLVQFGYQPTVQSFSATGKNVLATKAGVVPGSPAMLAGAHYDAMPGGVYDAPGADDNGSGTAAILEAARILSAHQFEHPIIFAFWDEEEQGLVGSAFHAGGLAANDVVLRGVINVDAIAYDSDDDREARIHSRPIGNSHEIADSVFAVRAHYNIDLDLLLTVPGATYSDHASFWNEGYGAILIIEDFTNDGNPFYHTPNDKVEHFNVPYFEKLARLSIATLATMAVPVTSSTGLSDATGQHPRLTAWPNPARDEMFLWVTASSDEWCRISVLDAMGREIAMVKDGRLMTGRQMLEIPITEFAPGTYYIRSATNTVSTTIKVVRIP
jgi:hypothetical protein